MVLERNQLHIEDRPLSLLEKLHDKDYYYKRAFLGRVAAQHPLQQGLKATRFKTQAWYTGMTETIDWFKVRMWELKKLLHGSDYNTIYDESGAKVIGDLTEWLKMKGAAKFQNNLNPVVAITENDDVVFLQDFEEAPTDRSKAIIHLDGLYEFIKENVNQDS